jgi:pre-mRNA-splicing factor RBM22/SLT11
MLQRLARMTPYYKRNEARICTFYTKGQCNRGQDCPFRHELPEGGELAHQRLRDRFHGEDDPLAAKIMRRADEVLTLMPPEDKAITTLYLGGLEAGVKEKDVKDQFYVFGEIRSIKMVPKQSCAFVTFVERESAEAAAAKLHKILQIKGKKVNVMWGRPQQNKESASGAASSSAPGSSGGEPGMPPPGATTAASVYRPYYPSMDPAASGNSMLEGEVADDRGAVSLA